MAHQLHIQGYENKKRWAQELVEENKAVLAKAKTKAAQRSNARRMKEKDTLKYNKRYEVVRVRIITVYYA